MNGSEHWVKHPKLPWPPERVERLLKLKAAGLTSGDIAHRMGTTRGAIAGKLDRLKQDESAPRRQKTPTKVNTNTDDVQRTSVRPGRSGAPIGGVPAAPIQWSGIAAAVATLKPKECRWPLGGTQEAPTEFCRAPVKRRPYCAEHARISRYGTPGRKSLLTPEQERRVILQKLCVMRRMHTSDVAVACGCLAEEATAAMNRTSAWLRARGIRVTSAQAAGYWISPGDKPLAVALLKVISTEERTHGTSR